MATTAPLSTLDLPPVARPCRRVPLVKQLLAVASTEEAIRIGRPDPEAVPMGEPAYCFYPQPFRQVRPRIPRPPAVLEEAVAPDGHPAAPLLALDLPPAVGLYRRALLVVQLFVAALVTSPVSLGLETPAMIAAERAETPVYLRGMAHFEPKIARIERSSPPRPRRWHP